MVIRADEVKVGDRLVFSGTVYTVTEAKKVTAWEWGNFPVVALAFEGTNDGQAYVYEPFQLLQEAS